MTTYRFRPLDWFHTRYTSSDSWVAKNADEIIDYPEKHLMPQGEVFWAEGGPMGLLVQLGVSSGGLAGLTWYKPHYVKYFMNAQLRPMEWFWITTTVYMGHKVGLWLGAAVFGDRQKLRSHWMAYAYVKSCNRYEGRRILAKKPMFY